MKKESRAMHKPRSRSRNAFRTLLGTGARRWTAAVILVALVLAFIVTRTIVAYQQDLPSIEQIYSITPILPTKLYDRHGRQFKQFYRERRVLARYEELSPHLIDALLATEDRQFYHHWGFDWKGLFRAAVVNFIRGRTVQGGSTITQQLARLLFLTNEKTVTRKIKEILTAIRIERRYAKNEILEMYFNLNNFGGGAYGVKAAAHTYFSKDVSELDILESAVLVAALKAPSRYGPLNDPTRAFARRNVVLAALCDDGKITDREYDSLSALPLRLKPGTVEYGVGEYFSEKVRQYIERKYGTSGLYADGLEAYTTMDFDLQRAAEEIVRKQLDSQRAAMQARYTINDPMYTELVTDPETGKMTRQYKKLQAALFAIDNATGEIIAVVGGHDFVESQFDRATQAMRQPGSAFKPFVLTAAVEAGFMPRDTMYDSPIVLHIPGQPAWQPNNFDLKFKGAMTLRQGIAESRNLIAIRLLQKIDVQRAVFYAHQMGIESELIPVPTLAIGTSEVTLAELTEAFSCFPNNGIRTKPRYLCKVLDRYGNPLESNEVPQRTEALSAKTAYIVTSVLKSVIDEPEGTAHGIRRRGFDRPAGGKTGTSNEYMDTWFIGFTPQITCGIWVGYDQKTPVGGYHTGTGAANALPIWTSFMTKALDTIPAADFKIPEGVYVKNVCRQTGDIATDLCVDTYPEVFVNPDDTLKTCSLHRFDRRSRDHPEVKKQKKRIRF